MKIKLIIAASLVLTIASCKRSNTEDQPKQEIPKALADNNPSYEFSSKKSSYDDLVESLYNELLSKNIDLKKLEENIADLHRSKSDTTHLFYKFDEKNQAYFSSAKNWVAEIKDSLLREKMNNLIEENLTKYNTSIAKHQELLKLVDTKNQTIDDLHKALKIVKTLPLMEKYQHNNLPNIKSIEGYMKQQDATQKLEDALIKN